MQTPAQRKASITYRIKMINSGRCKNCGRKRALHSKSFCYYCLDKDANRKRRERMTSEDNY